MLKSPVSVRVLLGGVGRYILETKQYNYSTFSHFSTEYRVNFSRTMPKGYTMDLEVVIFVSVC